MSKLSNIVDYFSGKDQEIAIARLASNTTHSPIVDKKNEELPSLSYIQKTREMINLLTRRLRDSEQAIDLLKTQNEILFSKLTELTIAHNNLVSFSDNSDSMFDDSIVTCVISTPENEISEFEDASTCVIQS